MQYIRKQQKIESDRMEHPMGTYLVSVTEMIEKLRGFVDVFLTDFKYFDSKISKKYLHLLCLF